MSVFLRLLVFILIALTTSVRAQDGQGSLAPLVIGTEYRFLEFDPAHALSSTNMYFGSALFETLLILGDDGFTLEPGVAKSWEVSDDGLVYTFHLREDAKWSDGEPVVANHFVAGWFRVLMPDTRAPYATLHETIHGADALREKRAAALLQWAERDEVRIPEVLGNWRTLKKAYSKSVWSEGDFTLKVRLIRPVVYFPYLVTNPAFAPLPGEIGKLNFDLDVGFDGRLRIEAMTFHLSLIHI